MCGIAGVYSLNPEIGLLKEIEMILEAQHRRGPDFRGIEQIATKTGNLIFGHNRLSIIDLSAAANQPMWDYERRVCIVFNGEIYNYLEIREELIRSGHQFETVSDTEVILESYKHWGTDSFRRFNGMFAFGLFDTTNQRLLLVRDRFGVKPLYCVCDDSSVRFASTPGEMARIMHLSPNPEYLADGVRYGLYDRDLISPFRRMNAVSPGHYITAVPAAAGGLMITENGYYDLEERVNTLSESLASAPEDQILDGVLDLIGNAVMIRLRSDVPVAVSLSGGLDSTTISAIAAKYHPEDLHGFTFGSPDDFDSEGPQAAELKTMVPICLHFEWPDAKTICKAFDECLLAQSGPFPNGSIVAQYLVFKKAHEAGFKVMLGGQGGDESFMGYRKFQWFHLRQMIKNRRLPSAVLFFLSLLPTVIAEKHRWVESWKNRHIYSKGSGRETIMKLPEVCWQVGHNASEALRKRQMSDIYSNSLPTLLRYEDSNSMGNSVESRLPFLDYRLLEYGVALPTAMKLRKGYGKWIIRQSMRGTIPESVRLARYKKGFDVQQNRWIDAGLGEHIRSQICANMNVLREWFGSEVKPETNFSDDQLKRNPLRFAEATTLLWLAAR